MTVVSRWPGVVSCALTLLSALVVLALVLRQRQAAALVARVAHEIRGPLCGAQLGLEAMAVGEQAARIAAVQLELRRAALALEELTQARGRRHARRGEGRGPVDMGALLEDARAAWAAVAAAHGAHLQVETATGLWVHGEPLRLAQACANLVTNAAEHGGGAVLVHARIFAGSVRVEVTDEGPGLPAPVGLLVAAARGRASRRGHGLANAAAVAARHGGRLAAGPSPRGARLVLELPAATAAASAAAP